MSRNPWLAVRLLCAILILAALSACGRKAAEPRPQAGAPVATTVPAATRTTAPVATPLDPDKTITTDSGLQYTEVVAGDGPQPQPGDVVTVHYTGKLQDDTVFDSSYSRNEPIRFALGMGMVIPGWDEGIGLMREGGQAILVIPPGLAYGERGAGDVIPPNATLIFDVQLISVEPGAPAAPTVVDAAAYTTTAQGLTYADLVVGDGPSPMNGQLVVVHYTGWLQGGGKFDSSLDRGEPYSFNLGMGQVIAGWDLGVKGMRVGGKRQLIIPPQLGYGDRGAGGVIPPNATLVFEIELLELR
jgi:peptidylprolyl isomerase